MKYFMFIITILVLALMYLSCKKREGVYHPKQKISSIYYKDYEESKELVEKWTWSDENLRRITAGDNSYYWDFQYNDKDQIEKITFSEGGYYSFSYDNKLIKAISFYTDENDLYETYEFDHTKKKITTVTYTYYGYKSISLIAQYKPTVLRCFLMEPLGHNLFPASKADIPVRKDKAETVSTYEYTWDGDNIESLVISSSANKYITTCNYKYDNAKNPFYYSFQPWDVSEVFIPLKANIIYSKNNVCIEYGTVDNREYEIRSNFKYENAFPIVIDMWMTYADTDTNYLGTYYYTYN